LISLCSSLLLACDTVDLPNRPSPVADDVEAVPPQVAERIRSDWRLRSTRISQPASIGVPDLVNQRERFSALVLRQVRGLNAEETQIAYWDSQDNVYWVRHQADSEATRLRRWYGPFELPNPETEVDLGS
jgi:hypothetical protein